MTAAACNLQRISRMLRNNLYLSSNVNTSFKKKQLLKKLIQRSIRVGHSLRQASFLASNIDFICVK